MTALTITIGLPFLAILAGALLVVLGFYAGVAYCGRRMLPRILADMDPRTSAIVLNEAMRIRHERDPDSPFVEEPGEVDGATH